MKVSLHPAQAAAKPRHRGAPSLNGFNPKRCQKGVSPDPYYCLLVPSHGALSTMTRIVVAGPARHCQVVNKLTGTFLQGTDKPGNSIRNHDTAPIAPTFPPSHRR